MTKEPEAGEPLDEEAELEAIAAILRIVKPFDEAAKRRVVGFVADKVGIAPAPAGGALAAPASGARAAAAAAAEPELPTYNHFAELANRIRPKSDVERALIASYWVQVVQATSPFGSTEVNALLKEISAGLGHVADAMTALQVRKPALVIHLKKSGPARQAKKTYLVTPEGIEAVQTAIRAGGFAAPPEKGKAS